MRKPTPTAPELAASITAAEATLAALKESRADLRRQVDFLETQRDECLRLNTQRAVYESDYLAGRRFGKDLESFWRTHSEEAVNGRLKRVMEGGCPMLATITESGFESNGRQVFSSRQVELTLPALGQVKDALAKAEADILAADVALRELKGSSRATFEAAVTTAQKALSAARTQRGQLEAALGASRDVDEALGFRVQLDQAPMRENLLERAVVEAEVALLEADCPATDAEIRAASAVIAGLEEELKEVNARLLKARLALERLRGDSKDTATQANRLRDRLAELEFAWTQKLVSREVRSPAPLALAGRF